MPSTLPTPALSEVDECQSTAPLRFRSTPSAFPLKFALAKIRGNRGLRSYPRSPNHSLRCEPPCPGPRKNSRQIAEESTPAHRDLRATADIRDGVILAKPPPVRLATTRFRSRVATKS